MSSVVETILRRRLESLNHFDPQWFELSDETKFRQCVLWLEEQKIRFYDIDRRQPLRRITAETGAGWDEAYRIYLRDLECGEKTRESQLLWLTAKAVKEEFAQMKADDVKAASLINDKAEIGELAKSLGIQENPQDPQATLKACCLLLKKKQSDNNADKKGLKSVDLDEMQIKTEKGTSANLNKALKLLKLLQIQDLREAQNAVNAAIESVQMLTANPKTDTKLGKVGR